MLSDLHIRFGFATMLLSLLGCNGREDELIDQVVHLRQLVDTSATQVKRAKHSVEVMQGELDDSRNRLAEMPGTLDLEVAFQMGKEPLELSKPYETKEGTMEYGSLRYWLSNVSLVNRENERVEVPNSYYLMEHTTVPRDRHEDPVVWIPKHRDRIELRGVPAGEYHAIAFDVGVDPAHNNDMSIPGGELNVLNNMATAKWMWFTSYVFASLWGKMIPAADSGASTNSEQPLVLLSWETGGNEDLRRVELTLPEPIRVGADFRPKVHCALDASYITHGFGEAIISDSQANSASPSSSIGPDDDERQQFLATNWQIAFTLQPVTVEP